MLTLSIPDVKGFMTKLLKENAFDGFMLRNAVINSFARFEIFGANTEECVMWGAVRQHVLGIVKGERPPKSIKIILGGNVENTGIADATALSVNIHFEDSKVNITTGISKKNFSLDKSDGKKWDAHVLKFLDDNQIKYINNIQ